MIAIVGPATVRVSAEARVDTAVAAAALEGIDDNVTLLDDRPAKVAALWRTLLASFDAERQGPLTLVFPSWWPSRRVGVVAGAAGPVDGPLTMRRSALLARAARGYPVVTVEIASHLVAVSRIGSAANDHDERPVFAQPREGSAPDAVADAVARAVASMRDGAAVVVDAPGGVGGAEALAAMIANRVHGTVVEDDELLRAAAAPAGQRPPPAPAGGTTSTRKRLLAVAASLALAVGSVTAVTTLRAGDAAVEPMPMTVLVEGRLAVKVPSRWAVHRITAGPGSARVRIASPSDADAALHVTQSPVPSGETLQRTAETLRRAIGDQPPGVFVDFNPADRIAARPAVTYREIRPGHDIRWAVLLDAPIRISIGCQSAAGRDDTVRHPCEQAVASARAVTQTVPKVAGTESTAPQSKP